MALTATSEDWSHWPAPAKLNLFLRITGRRADGYHLLQTVFQLLEWGDRIDLRIRQDGAILRTHGAADVAAEDDLCIRAARLLRHACPGPEGVDIAVHKQIPLGGGFGGGSSDAATTLLALNRLWGCGLDVGELAALGLRLGADVPVFVRGRTAWAEGVGEQLQPIELPERWVVVIDSGIRVSTQDLFQAPELTRNAIRLTMEDFASVRVGENAFTPLMRARSAHLAALLDAVGELGAGGMTGTGGGCFLLATSRQDALDKAAALSRFGRVVVTRAVAQSSLLGMLERDRSGRG